MNQLLDLHEEHRRPFEAELIRAGFRWRDFPSPDFTWGDLAAVIECMEPHGPLARAIDPAAVLTVADQFLRSAEHSLRWLVWAKSKDARTGRPPEPWRFTWEQDTEDTGYRTDEMTAAEVNAFLGWDDMIREENARRAAAGRPLLPT